MKMRVSMFTKWRLVKIKFFMIAVILFSTYLFVSYTLIQIVTSKTEKFAVDSTAINLPNVVMHLDFKGSPPKISYLKSLLPKLQDLGVTGFLIEYEDMFPYEGRLVNLSAKNVYEKSELQEFLKLTVQLGFDIIPLIQTFGHMEHVLKLREYQHLREIPLYSDTICPSKSESRILIKNMLKQVIKFHESIFPLKYFHIGSDEVYHINKCDQCLKRKQTNTNIYVEHVKAITNYIKKLSPKTVVLIWEDMLRGITMDEWETIKGLRIEPVCWDYESNLKVSHISLIKYHKKFDNIWIASAFKGADGSTATLPNLKKRFLNHLSWMQLVQNYKFGGEQDTYTFKGIILTGWSRYTHMSPLCELLPVSMPSLFLNLLLIKKFKRGENWVASNDLNDFFNKNLNDDFTGNLHCRDDVNMDHFDIRQCYFDGNDLYQILKHCDMFVADILTNVNNVLEEKSNVWDNSNYVTQEHKTINWKNKTVEDLSFLEAKMVKILSQYYGKHFVEEYVNYKLNTSKKMLNELFKDQDNIFKVRSSRR